MTFTNMLSCGLYFACCHREVEPGGSFEVPWLEARVDRAVRAAMADGSLAWESGKDEPNVPGSAHVPTEEERREMAEKARVEAEERRLAEAEAARERMALDEAGVRENMARMGEFELPKPIHPRTPEASKPREKPVTPADIISDGRRPRSLDDVMRHNRAVRAMRTAGSGTDAGKGKAGKAADETKEGKNG